MKNIVIIGGGTGTSTLLQGLKKYPTKLSVIVSTADDGGSNFTIRKDFGIIPPSDIRQCLVALSTASESLKQLFKFRFSRGEFKGHTAGNIIFAAFYEIYGNANATLQAVSEMLKIKGEVMPVTLTPTVLSTILTNGKKISGEHNIDDRDVNKPTAAIKDIKLSAVKVNPKVLAVIKKADVIIFGPGDLYTSTIPNLLVKGVVEAINKSSAKKILITNIMTKFGQSDGFKASDFSKVMEKYLKGKINVVLVNNKQPATEVLKKYSKEKAKPVEADINNLKLLKVDVIAQDLLSTEVFTSKAGDKLKRSLLRHDSNKLAKLIWNLI